jgi:hypothetical protein
MKHQTKLSRIQDGQSKAQTQGAKRKPVVVKGLGLAIVAAMEQAHLSTRQAILACVKQNPETIAQAIMEVEQKRDERISECKGERKVQKIASVRVMFSRITVILKAIHKGFNVSKITDAPSFAIMYAYASNKAKRADGRHAKPFSEEQFTRWNDQAARVIGEQPGKNAKDSERGKFDKQLARLEQHIVDTLGTLAKYAHVTKIPVRDMLGLIAKQKKQVRVVQQRKAA